MYIDKITLINYRNYKKAELEFGKQINIIYGNNAAGKTNILEAIYVCCLTKSHRTIKDVELINFDKDRAKVIAEFEETKVSFEINKKNEKIIKENDIVVKKFGDFIGKNPIVIFSPENIDIIKGVPQKRRKFLNIIISQISRKYLINLQEYNKYLQIKNAMLKEYKNKRDDEYLDIIDEMLSEKIEQITIERTKRIEQINEKAKKIHFEMTNKKEAIEIKYKTDFHQKDKKQILEILKISREYDFLRRASSKGIHHDDFLVIVNGEEVSKYGSQGQNRTSLLTLKFAEFEILKEEKEEIPIILLDDVSSELDKDRIKFLLNFIKDKQVFITTTQIDTLKITKEMKIFQVKENGLVIEKGSW